MVWAVVVGMMAYRLNESPWRRAFVALVFVGIGSRDFQDHEVCGQADQSI